MQVIYEYKCNLRRVIDGDTIVVDIDLGFKVFLLKQTVRLHGIDTPESRTRNLHEKHHGLASKERLKQLLKGAETIPSKRGKKQIYLQTSMEGKRKVGRLLGTRWVNGQNVNEILISENHARPYFGGSKGELGEWTQEIDGIDYCWTPGGYIKHEGEI